MTMSLSKADELAREQYGARFNDMATSGLPYHLVASPSGLLITAFPHNLETLVADVHTMSERQMAQALRRKLKHHTPECWK